MAAHSVHSVSQLPCNDKSINRYFIVEAIYFIIGADQNA